MSRGNLKQWSILIYLFNLIVLKMVYFLQKNTIKKSFIYHFQFSTCFWLIENWFIVKTTKTTAEPAYIEREGTAMCTRYNRVLSKVLKRHEYFHNVLQKV